MCLAVSDFIFRIYLFINLEHKQNMYQHTGLIPHADSEAKLVDQSNSEISRTSAPRTC